MMRHLCTLLVGLSLVTVSNAQDDSPTQNTPQVTPEHIAKLELRIAKLEAKLDVALDVILRIESLLNTVHSAKLKAAQSLQDNPLLEEAINKLAEIANIPNLRELWISTDANSSAQIVALLKNAMQKSQDSKLAFEDCYIQVVAHLASKGDYFANNSKQYLTTLAANKPEAIKVLVTGLLRHNSPASIRAALWAVPLIKDAPPMTLLSEIIRTMSANLDTPTSDLLLVLAMAAHSGDTISETLLKDLLRGGEFDARFAYDLATRLRGVGSKLTFKIMLELTLNKKYAYAASQTFARISGFKRRISIAEITTDPKSIYSELSRWLMANYSRIIFNRGKFLLK